MTTPTSGKRRNHTAKTTTAQAIESGQAVPITGQCKLCGNDIKTNIAAAPARLGMTHNHLICHACRTEA